MLSRKANGPSLKISIPFRSFTPQEHYKDESAAMGPLPHENILPKDRILSFNSAFGLADNNVGMAGDSTKKKAQI